MNDMSGKPSSLSVFAIYAIALLAEGAGTVVIPLWVLSLNPTPTMFGIVIGAKGLLPLLFSIHGGVLMDFTGRIADRFFPADLVPITAKSLGRPRPANDQWLCHHNQLDRCTNAD